MTDGPRDPAPPSREALEKELRSLRVQLERSDRYRRRLESLKDQNDLFLRNVIEELRATQDALEESKADLERRVDERTRALTRANAELAAARDAAVAANRTKSAFLATMSHELRTPLNVIIGYAELARELAVEAGADVLIPDLQKIGGAAEHLLLIIGDILDLAKIEAGKTRVEPEPVDVAALVVELAGSMRPLVARGHNELVLDIEPELGLLTTDRLKLRQILWNLLSNACKFTTAGVVTLSVRRERDVMCFAVRDTGIGIAAEDRGQLFQPFDQLDSSPTRRHSGTGLGLAICGRFAEMLRGTIEVESQPGVGSTFSVRFPV